MAQERNRPAKVFYDDLKSFGHLSNRQVANAILLKKCRTIMADQPSRISRELVNADPDIDISHYYCSPNSCTDELIACLNRTISNRRGDKQNLSEKLLARYGSILSEPVQNMCDALEAHGRQTTAYTNLVERIAFNQLADIKQKAYYCFMLFILCGIYGEPDRAVAETEEAFRAALAKSIGTVQAEDFASSATKNPSPTIEPLGLLRVVNGLVPAQSQILALALPPAKTTIGARDCTITDVAADVSRKHLAIWHDGNNWVCQGLGSLNGTQLISGADKRVSVIELPRAQKTKGSSPICQIHAGDTLCLGANTRFLIASLNVG